MPDRRKQLWFVVRFLALLIAFYVAVSLEPVHRLAVTPFTVALARVSGAILNLFGENVSVSGSSIAGEKFAVEVSDGCNGIEALVFLCAAMIAFPAPIRERLLGVVAGSLAVQLLNLVRIVSLYLLGRYQRDVFDMFHLGIWQSVIFGAAVFIFFYWTSRVQRDGARAAA